VAGCVSLLSLTPHKMRRERPALLSCV